MKYLILNIFILIILAGVFYFFFDYIFPPQFVQVLKPASDNLIIEDLKTGAGQSAKTGDTVFVNYIGTLLNGIKFDSSYDRGEPFSFILGQGAVIKGWDQGLLGMKAGGKRKIIIPPFLAYGAGGAPGIIPPDSTLIFEVELLNIK